MKKTLEKIELNLFTNCSIYSPSIEIIKETYISFCQTFDPGQEIKVKVFCDSHPFAERINEYVINLKRLFDEIHVTDSLSDGYLESIRRSSKPFLFQLEADWVFNNNVDHSLSEILSVMECNNLYHFRFNKRQNIAAGWDKKLSECCCDGLNYCLTGTLSNNPHIIDRVKYEKDISKMIKPRPGSKGIEEMLSRRGLTGAIYGPLHHAAAVTHIDGRKGAKVKI
jgi:hypothetical protein